MSNSNQLPTLLLQGVLKGYSLKNLRWILNQAHLETGHFQSRVFNELNNPFGMSRVYIRPTTQIGFEPLNDGNTAGIYKSKWSAIKDRFLWDKEFGISPTSETYSSDVSKVYHSSPNYETSVSNTRADLHGGFGIQSWLLLLLPLPILIGLYVSLKKLS